MGTKVRANTVAGAGDVAEDVAEAGGDPKPLTHLLCPLQLDALPFLTRHTPLSAT